jgi:hypothetical protein
MSLNLGLVQSPRPHSVGEGLRGRPDLGRAAGLASATLASRDNSDKLKSPHSFTP